MHKRITPLAPVIKVIIYISLAMSYFYVLEQCKLGSVACPVIQGNGRLTFEDALRSGGMFHYTVNQHPHWACRQYGHSGGTRRWLGVERCQLFLHDTSHSAKCHRRAAVGHWISFCVCEVL